MTDFFTKERIRNIVIASMMIVLGILFICLRGGDFLQILGYIVGALLMVLGVVFVLVYFVNFKHGAQVSNFIWGAFAFVVGLMLVISGAGLLEWLLVVFVALFLVYVGIFYMAKAFEQIRQGFSGWWKPLVYGILSFVFGIVLLILQITAIQAVMIFVGVALIITGLCLLALVVFMDRVVLKLKKQNRK